LTDFLLLDLDSEFLDSTHPEKRLAREVNGKGDVQWPVELTEIVSLKPGAKRLSELT